MNEEYSIPLWFRVLEITFGIIAIIIGGLVVFWYSPTIIRPLGYVPGTFIFLGPSVILFGILWLVRIFVYKGEKGWLRGVEALFGIIMISMGALSFYLDHFGIALLGSQFMGTYNYAVGYLAIIFLLEAVLWILLSVLSNPDGWFRWFIMLLSIIELVFALTALIFVPSAFFLTTVLVILSGLILVFKGIAAQLKMYR